MQKNPAKTFSNQWFHKKILHEAALTLYIINVYTMYIVTVFM